MVLFPLLSIGVTFSLAYLLPNYIIIIDITFKWIIKCLILCRISPYVRFTLSMIRLLAWNTTFWLVFYFVSIKPALYMTSSMRNRWYLVRYSSEIQTIFTFLAKRPPILVILCFLVDLNCQRYGFTIRLNDGQISSQRNYPNEILKMNFKPKILNPKFLAWSSSWLLVRQPNVNNMEEEGNCLIFNYSLKSSDVWHPLK